jgi:hypothetical protein
MRLRFFITLALALSAGFMIVETQAFAAGTAAWLGFAVGIGATVLGGGLLYDSLRHRRGPAWLAVPGIGLVIAGWDIVSSLVFADPTAKWLVFANGCGLLAASLVALVLHEVSTERVVHSLEFGERRAEVGPQDRERVPA